MEVVKVVREALNAGPYSSNEQTLLWFILCNYLFLVTEIICGIYWNSLGLICDGIHMFLHCIGVTISWITYRLSHWSKATPNLDHTYGYYRLETLAAFVNATILIFVAAFLGLEAGHKVFANVNELSSHVTTHEHHEVLVSFCSLLLNGSGLMYLRKQFYVPEKLKKCRKQTRLRGVEEADENIEAVFLHLRSDIYSSLGILFSSLLKTQLSPDPGHTNFASQSSFRAVAYLDGAVSLFILCLMMFSAVPIALKNGRILLQAGSDRKVGSSAESYHLVSEIERLKRYVESGLKHIGVIEIYEFHTWSVAKGMEVVTMKVRSRKGSDKHLILEEVQKVFEPVVKHLTVQIIADGEPIL